MTLKQQENQILALIGQLPLLNRVRIALLVLKGLNPDEVLGETPIAEEKLSPELEAELDRRLEELKNGTVEEIQGEEFLKELRSLRAS